MGGLIIGTTGEHPFWVEGKGWVEARELRIGDLLVSADGRPLVVEGVADSGRVETVYNVEVEDDHTYFVGCIEWGWELWAHNAKSYRDKAIKVRKALIKSGPNKGKVRVVNPRTNKTVAMDPKKTQGDHILPKAEIKAKVEAHIATKGLSKTKADELRAKAEALQDSKENLRLMPTSHNAAKGKSSGTDYGNTPTGSNADAAYVAGINATQATMRGKLNGLLAKY